MEIQKPKKALRGLFTRTEPSMETMEVHKAVSESKSEIDFNTEIKNVVQRKNQEEKILNQTAQRTSLEDSVMSEPVQRKNQEQEEAVTGQPLQSEKVDHSFAQPEISREDVIYSVPPGEVEVEINKKEVTKQPTPYAFVKIQYNLDQFKDERNAWKEQDYISFINRIDQAQTDAFFLKGRLVAEIKERFYADNKKGWTMFCDETLNMNYTTANQYIRVSQEFDVTSHQRKDFGFEHFKALLPLSKEERYEVIQNTPNNLSVKSLRDIVTSKLQNKNISQQPERNLFSAKNIVETLQKLKTQLSKLNSLSLSQEEKWQLYGAFQNLSEEMSSISNSFISSPASQESSN